ncbi:MAG: hypothetical protein JNM55_11100 [Anaerolineales bacterium]|nr:hypothetical protein [Anaerolineales bacterium]
MGEELAAQTPPSRKRLGCSGIPLYAVMWGFFLAVFSKIIQNINFNYSDLSLSTFSFGSADDLSYICFGTIIINSNVDYYCANSANL